jgi:hypothetical protein
MGRIAMSTNASQQPISIASWTFDGALHRLSLLFLAYLSSLDIVDWFVSEDILISPHISLLGLGSDSTQLSVIIVSDDVFSQICLNAILSFHNL